MRKSDFLKENADIIEELAQQDDDFAAMVDDFKSVSNKIDEKGQYSNTSELKKKKCDLKSKIQSKINIYSQEKKKNKCEEVA